MDKATLQIIVDELATQPGHEKTRSLTHQLLTQGLKVDSQNIEFEKRLKVNGRMDAITGRTIFEFKSNLKKETKAAEEQLQGYLSECEEETEKRFVGIATDGTEYRAYGMNEESVPFITESYKTDASNPRSLLQWLGRICAFQTELAPDYESIKKEFGRNSIVWKFSEKMLQRLWLEVKDNPDAKLKYQLWQRLLGFAYGLDIDDISLFLRHTYLSVLAKSIAWVALLEDSPKTAQSLMNGQAFEEQGIFGLGGEDFFAWIINTKGGDEFVCHLTGQANRFRLHDATSDIMKGLYESLIDPETRHELGEYYTPDWLAEKICKEAITDPLNQRVLDPSCGSGSFIFHAIRHILDKAEQEGYSPSFAIEKAVSNVTGIDIHPVATIIAQITFLLALLPTYREAKYADSLSIPIYLGDALQWWVDRPETDDLFTTSQGGLHIFVPKMKTSKKQRNALSLIFPMAITANHALFDETLKTMLSLIENESSIDAFKAWMRRKRAIVAFDYAPLAGTYKNMKRLHKEDRNHIWSFVARNLAHPVYLSEQRKADILIGNPPWVTYRFMKGEFKKRFKKECEKIQLWVGGNVATHQDLCAYFFMRVTHLYLKTEGKLAFVMPEATLSRKAYREFRKGILNGDKERHGTFKMTQVWNLPAECKPLFPVPACVLFGEKTDRAEIHALPKTMTEITGTLPRRDAKIEEAEIFLNETTKPYPKTVGEEGKAFYFSLFKNGASLSPRRFALVTYPEQKGQWQSHHKDRPVKGRIGNLDKAPWKDIPAPQGRIEEEFLKPVLLGSSIAPFRQLSHEKGVIPVLENHSDNITSYDLLDGKTAQSQGYPHLAKWMKEAETLWEKHKTPNTEESLSEWWNYRRKLLAQFPIPPLRVVYAASGMHVAAYIVTNSLTIIDGSLYWFMPESMAEATYLCAILNSQTAEKAMIPYQSQGQFGARHISKYIFMPPWPRFDTKNPLHQEIVEASKIAENIANKVELPEDIKFQKARSLIREALKKEGIAETINDLTAKLLN